VEVAVAAEAAQAEAVAEAAHTIVGKYMEVF